VLTRPWPGPQHRIMSRPRRAQVEASDQMRYLHHRMQSCPEERELLRRAAALAAAREPDHPPPLPLRPLQVRTTP